MENTEGTMSGAAKGTGGVPMDVGRNGVEAPALSIEEFRRLGYQAVDIAAAHLAGLDERPVFARMTPAERSSLLDQSLGNAPASPDDLLAAARDLVLAHPMGNGHPRFFGWVNSPPAPMGILADLLAATLNASCAGGDHAAIYVEHAVVRWLMELVGFPAEGSYGLLVSGGSAASSTCLAAARRRAALAGGWNDRLEGMQGDHLPLVLYCSTEGHSCLQKAVELLGLGAKAIHRIPVDDAFRLDVAALRAAIRADRAAGLAPFCVAASAGTVNTGAVDPLAAIADVCADEGLWFHVDGAYGAVGVLDETRADLYEGMERADSLALDPHKWLWTPLECGCALVRDGALLRDTFSLVPPYLRTEEGKGVGGLPWFSEYGFQQSRGFRALKLWMTLQHVGRAGLAKEIARHNSLARSLAVLVDDEQDLVLAAPVSLSIVAFRYRPTAGTDDEDVDLLNKRIVEEIQSGGEAFITGAVLHGRQVLRACIIHYKTTEQDLQALVDIVKRTGARCRAALVGDA